MAEVIEFLLGSDLTVLTSKVHSMIYHYHLSPRQISVAGIRQNSNGGGACKNFHAAGHERTKCAQSAAPEIGPQCTPIIITYIGNTVVTATVPVRVSDALPLASLLP